MQRDGAAKIAVESWEGEMVTFNNFRKRERDGFGGQTCNNKRNIKFV